MPKSLGKWLTSRSKKKSDVGGPQQTSSHTPSASSSCANIATQPVRSSTSERSRTNQNATAQGSESQNDVSGAGRPPLSSRDDSETTVLPEMPTGQSSGQESLWDKAYEALREEREPLLASYEELLARALPKKTDGPGSRNRRLDMQELAEAGVKRMDDKKLKYTIAGQEFNVTDQIALASETLTKLKSFIADAVSSCPQASLAWAGVSILLPLFTNPSTVELANRSGFNYVASRMRFYIGIEELRWPKDLTISAELRSELEDAISELYKSILTFQIESTLRFYRHSFPSILRDMVKWDDWKGMADKVKEAEATVTRYFSDINDIALVKGLESLQKSAIENFDVLQQQVSLMQQQLQTSQESNQLLKTIADETSRMGQASRRVKLDIHVVEEAIYNNYKTAKEDRCLEGTRQSIRQKIEEWGASTTGPNIFWLTGPAGTGKSTLARTLADTFTAGGSFVGGYFFKRGDKDRNGMSKVLSTLASQVAEAIPGFDVLVSESLGSMNKDALEKRPRQTQFKLLFSDPLHALPTQGAKVMIIDALDECSDQEDIYSLIDLLSQLNGIELPRFNVLFTSRGSTSLEESFTSLQEAGVVYHSMSLQEEYHEETKSDIEAYIVTRFAEIKKKRRIKRDPWPEAADLKSLLHHSTNPSPLFIYASSLFRFIDSKFSVVQQLEKWMQTTKASSGQLESIYMPILADVFDDLDDDQQHITRTVLGFIVFAVTPISAHTISVVLEIDLDLVHHIVRQFHAVLHQSEDSDTLIQLHHKSFYDFIVSEEAFSSSPYSLNIKTTNLLLASKCLSLMQKRLCQDICCLGSPSAEIQDIDDNLVKQHIPVALQYACKNWMTHILGSAQKLEDIDCLDIFLHSKLLHWLESVVLLKDFSNSIQCFQKMQQYSIHTNSLCSLNKFIKDACQLILDAAPTILIYPLQIYAGALIFSPTSSPVMRQYWKDTFERHQTLEIDGLDPEWGPILQPLENGMSSFWVGPICFSTDGTMIASANGRSITICDAYSGLCLKQIKVGFEIMPHALSFSPDGKLIACALNSGRVPVFNVLTGAMHDDGAKYCNLIHTHSHFRATRWQNDEGQLSGLDNEYVWDGVAWKERKLKPLQAREGGSALHDWMMDSLKSVSFEEPWMRYYGLETAWYEIFSTDGKLVASPSPQKSILVWSAETGRIISELKGHTDSICSMEFAPNVKYLASADCEGLVNIWDIADDYKLLSSRQMRTEAYFFRGIQSLAFSSSGKLLAVGCNEEVYVLNALNGTIAVVLDNIGINAESLAFSPDELRLASKPGHMELHLYIWTLGELTQIEQSNKREITTVDMSLALGQLAIGYSDGTIELRDTITHSLVGSRGTSDNMEVSHVSFSGDGNRLAYGLDSGRSIIVTDTHTKSVEFSCSSTQCLVFSFCPSGKSIAVWNNWVSPQEVTLWDVASGTILHVFSNPTDTTPHPSVVFSDDGRLVAYMTGDVPTYVQIWDVPTMNLKATFWDHRPSSRSLPIAYIDDNQSVLCCSPFGTATTRDLNTGRIDLQRRYTYFPQDLDWNMRASRDKTILKTEFGPFDILEGDFCNAYTGEEISETYVRDGWIIKNGQRAIYLPRRLGYEAESVSGVQRFQGKTFFYRGCLIIVTNRRLIRVFQDLSSTV